MIDKISDTGEKEATIIWVAVCIIFGGIGLYSSGIIQDIISNL